MTYDGRWPGWLREVVVRAPDPDDAARYYAEILGAAASGNVVELGSATRIVIEEGAPGLALARLDVAADLGLSDGIVTDADGWRLSLESRPAIPELASDPEPRLGHLTFLSPDPLGQEGFYSALDFRLSEALGTMFRWMRCNPIHHTFAFQRAPEPQLHHLAIELPDRAALVAACDRLADLDHAIEFGPGRHAVGGNLFAYFLDRHGLRIELFCELRRVAHPEEPPLLHDEEFRVKSINVWGPKPPESFRSGLAQPL
jgi:catechol 2,3-dioxygenase-like lactoylglutathione lyase family enzyme